MCAGLSKMNGGAIYLGTRFGNKFGCDFIPWTVSLAGTVGSGTSGGGGGTFNMIGIKIFFSLWWQFPFLGKGTFKQ